jgi:RNA polymerase sigma-70 factor, ECF subfamily
MTSDDSFNVLMGRLRGGDEAAAEEIFRRYAGRLMGLARSRLRGAIRRKMDPDDVVQSAFRSFFRRQREGQFELPDWGSLWGLLAQITLHKCGHRLRGFRAARRDVRREVERAPGSADSVADWEAIAREPTPQEAAVLTETLEQVMAGLDGPQRQTLELTLQGHQAAQIARQLRCTERTVFRVLARVRDRLERLRAEHVKG